MIHMNIILIVVSSYINANVALYLCEKHRVHSIWSMMFMVGAMLMPFIIGGLTM